MGEIFTAEQLFRQLTNASLWHWFALAAGILLVLTLVCRLKKYLFNRLNSFFFQNTFYDEAVAQKLSLYAWGWAFIFPIDITCGYLWNIFLRSQTAISKSYFSVIIGFLFFLPFFLLLVSGFKFLHFFEQCYVQKKQNIQRPIRAILTVLRLLMLISVFASFVAFLTKQRPIVVLSSFGAGAALFIFAFQNILSSIMANLQINAEKIVQLGDLIAIDSKGIKGTVEMISAHTIKVRNEDMSLISFPVKQLIEEAIINYDAMFRSGARQIKRSIFINLRSIRFLTMAEVEQLKQERLVNDGMLKKADENAESERLSGSHCWTNIELFCLYAEDYLQRRPDIRHDKSVIVRYVQATSKGIPLEIDCFSSQTHPVLFEQIQRSVFFHLFVILPAFSLRAFQESSDFEPEEEKNAPCPTIEIFKSGHPEK